MLSPKTLEDYITKCDTVLNDNDTFNADIMVDEILSVLGSYLPQLRSGLSKYGFIAAASNGKGNTSVVGNEVDHIKDLSILRNRLIAELDGMEFSIKQKQHSQTSEQDEFVKPYKLFISHATKNSDYVKLLINLLEDIGLNESNVFCSSMPSYGVPLDEDIYDYLSKQFNTYNLRVLFILSDEYYESPASLNEMGAAWILKSQYTSILLPRFDFRSIRGAVNPNKAAIKIDSAHEELTHRLGELKDNLINEFGLQPIQSTRWERYRDEFINNTHALAESKMLQADIDETSSEIPPKPVITRDAAVLLVYTASDKSGRGIVFSRSLSGTSISGGIHQFILEQTPREIARWTGAIKELERLGLINATNLKRDIFEVTRSGFDVADEMKGKLDIDITQPPSSYFEPPTV